MANYSYYTPTKVIFGADAELMTGKQVKAFGGTKVLIHYGGGSVIRSGLLERVEKALTEENIPYVKLGGAVPNPHLQLVYEGIELAKKENVDFVLGVGGGSAIDSAKAIALGVANEGDVWDFYGGKRRASACLPIGAVLTMAATGTEMSNSTVITNEDGMLKRGYGDDLNRPKFAIMNPDLTKTLPAYQTASGCADIMMHTMERYFNGVANNMEITDSIAEALIRTVMASALVLVDDPENSKARAEIMWAGSLSHNGLTGFGTDGGDWMCHKMEHELGGMFDVTHGAGLAALWGSWAKYVIDAHPERFARFAVNVLGIAHTGDDMETGLLGIDAMVEFFRKIKMPTTIKELGVEPTAEQIDEMAYKCASAIGGQGGSIKKLRQEDMAAIYTAALN